MAALFGSLSSGNSSHADGSSSSSGSLRTIHDAVNWEENDCNFVAVSGGNFCFEGGSFYLVRATLRNTDLESAFAESHGPGHVLFTALHPPDHFLSEVVGGTDILRHDGISNLGVSNHSQDAFDAPIYYIIAVHSMNLREDWEERLRALSVCADSSALNLIAIMM
jgi:hypothetical protein